MDRNRRSVLITGASSGIGRACATHLAQRGWRVWAAVRHRTDAEHLRAESDQVAPVLMDVTAPQSIQQAVGAIDGPLSGLVNSAGVSYASPVELFPIHDLRQMFEINVFGVVAVTQAVLPLLRAGGGRIVNIGSVAGFHTLPCFGPYSASKRALEAISEALRMELDIPVSIVVPSGVKTPIWEKSAAKTSALLTRAPAQMANLYRPLTDAVDRSCEKAARLAMPVSRVVAAVEHALNADSPKVRYIVGADTRIRHAFGLLPYRLRSWLISRMIGVNVRS